MGQKMSVQSRRELAARVRPRYQQASRKDKGRILNEFIAATGYDRKYATVLLRKEVLEGVTPQPRQAKRTYDEPIRVALVAVWNAANRICSKRLVPFLPELVSAMERHGHLSLPEEVRQRLLSVSVATVDRLLRSERQRTQGGISTTRPGQLLKSQIPVRTFTEWSDAKPGFFEADLVAHCGDRAEGCYLYTLTLTDIASGWTECVALLGRSEADVTGALDQLRRKLPFPLLGLDTDNGGEFINWSLLRYCQEQGITFTRSRAYKKNDQAHVEEKNGSVVRRVVGYDRFEGVECWRNLAALYRELRLYVNYFQPSLKLLSKQREGAKVSKRYDKAQTPCQRIMASDELPEEIKAALGERCQALDPVALLREIETCQDRLWSQARSEVSAMSPTSEIIAVARETLSSETELEIPMEQRRYHRTAKERVPHTWRTRKDPFEEVWNRVRLQLEIDPTQTAKALFEELRREYPGQFGDGQLRSLQRRVKEWRRKHLYQTAIAGELPLEPDTVSDASLSTAIAAALGSSAT